MAAVLTAVAEPWSTARSLTIRLDDGEVTLGPGQPRAEP
jgi:hypothetical protein